MVHRIHGETSRHTCKHCAPVTVLSPWDTDAHTPTRLFNYRYNDTAVESTVEAFGLAQRATFQAASGMSSPEVYVNYAHGDEDPSVLYGSGNLPRLRKLKETWDPTGMFSFYNSF